MPFCPQCGVENPPSARFCDQCGAQLIPVPAQSSVPAPSMPTPAAPLPAATGATIVAGPSVCPQCGTAVIPGEAFCDSCGASLLTSTPAAPAPAAPTLPYGGVPPQPTYPAPQPVGTTMPQPAVAQTQAPAAAPPLVPPTIVTPPARPAPVAPPPPPAAPARSNLAGIRLLVQPSGAMVALPGAAEAVIGRADPVSNFSPDVDLGGHGALENGVGRRHGRVFIQNGQVFVEDLDSTNGSFLNASRLAPRSPQPLRDGDELRLGNLVLKVRF